MTTWLSVLALADLPGWALYAGLGALGLGLLGVLTMAVPVEREMTTEERVSRYTSGIAPGLAVRQEDNLATAKSAAQSLLKRNKSLEMRIAARLEAAGSQLNASEWLLLHTGIMLAAGFLGTVIGGGSLGIGLLFLAFGAIGPWFYLGFRKRRRRKAFGAALPDTLQLMAGSLSAGLSLAQSIDTIVNEGVEPIASEFRRVLVEARLGVSSRDRTERRGRALREQGLRVGRDGHQHPASRRWQPGRAAGDGRRHHA